MYGSTCMYSVCKDSNLDTQVCHLLLLITIIQFIIHVHDYLFKTLRSDMISRLHPAIVKVTTRHCQGYIPPLSLLM